MDEFRLKLLRADLRRQQQQIDHVYETLQERAERAAPGSPAYIDSLAYQLHNFYSAIEDLLQIIAGAFENSVTDLSQWHSQLIQRMMLDIEGVRPALLTQETAQLLQQLRAFRHFFRHAYGAELDYQRVVENLERARQIRPLLEKDIEQFLATLGG